MWKLTSAVVVVALAVILVPPAGAQSQGLDSVVGEAEDCLFEESCTSSGDVTQSLAADVHSGPSGEEPTGTMAWNNPFDVQPIAVPFSRVSVTCLSVTGRVAIVGVTGAKTYPRLGLSISIAGLVRVIDGGGPDSGLDTFELAIVEAPFGPQPPPPLPGPEDCSAFPEGQRLFVNDSGDLVVTDADPLPTSKQQCKNNAWRDFGVFKNQGDCVSFVREQARRACIFELVAHGRPAFRAKYGIGPHRVLAMWSCVHRRIGF